MARKLHVYQTLKPRVTRVFEPMPQIVLQGKWLKELGFSPGDSLEIRSDNNQIHISKTP